MPAETDPPVPELVLLDEEGGDKYALSDLPEIDCEARYPICQAACCTLRFPLSPQDLDEGVIRWDPVLRYLIQQGDSGFCSHLDLASCRCTVYEQRPGPCRTYSCRDDERIWEDFDARIPSPRLWTRTWRREAVLAGYLVIAANLEPGPAPAPAAVPVTIRPPADPPSASGRS